MHPYLALPREVVLLISAPIQWDQQVRAAIAVGKRETGGGHLLSRGHWTAIVLASQHSTTPRPAAMRAGLHLAGVTSADSVCAIVVMSASVGKMVLVAFSSGA